METAPRAAMGSSTSGLADPEHLSERQRVGHLRVLGAEAEEQRPETEHEHQDERGDHVVPGAPAQRPDAERASYGEDGQAPDDVEAEQPRAGRASGGARSGWRARRTTGRAAPRRTRSPRRSR